MAALVLKNLPDRLHKRLKKEAERNRRSMMGFDSLTALMTGKPLARAPVEARTTNTRNVRAA